MVRIACDAFPEGKKDDQVIDTFFDHVECVFFFKFCRGLPICFSLNSYISCHDVCNCIAINPWKICFIICGKIGTNYVESGSDKLFSIKSSTEEYHTPDTQHKQPSHPSTHLLPDPDKSDHPRLAFDSATMYSPWLRTYARHPLNWPWLHIDNIRNTSENHFLKQMVTLLERRHKGHF